MTTNRYTGFIAPDPLLQDVPFNDLHKHLGVPIFSGHRADLKPYRGLNFLFDKIIARTGTQKGYEDQCSAQYYYDLFDKVNSAAGEFRRIVEVGVYLGGASTILGGCAAQMELELDLVDINPKFLKFSYERIRRSFPEQSSRVRLFHGDLPTYVREVLLKEPDIKFFVQHDGAHDFNQVVRDLGALSFVREDFHSIAIQDTHLRGLPKFFNFVDSAVFAIFGYEMKYLNMGVEYTPEDELMVNPNQYQGNYFVPHVREGMYVPMKMNEFKYPHPKITLDQFFES